MSNFRIKGGEHDDGVELNRRAGLERAPMDAARLPIDSYCRWVLADRSYQPQARGREPGSRDGQCRGESD